MGKKYKMNVLHVIDQNHIFYNPMKSVKIIIITQGLNPIVKALVESYKVVGVIESAPRNYLKWSKRKRFLHKFQTFVRFSLEKYCKINNIPYFFMTKNDSELENWVREKEPDLIVVYSMSQLLKENIFNIPKYGTVNLHPAHLPKYRGPNPIFWQYYYQEKKIGITLHYIDKGEDTGDIIYQEELEIPMGIKLNTLKEILLNLGIKLLFKYLENWDNSPRIKQPSISPTVRAKNISIDEYKNLIDWENFNVERLWHILRGTEEYFNKVKKRKFGFRWYILGYEKSNFQDLILGEIYQKNGKYFIACKDGKIFLSEKFSFKQFFKDILGVLK